MIGFRVIWLKKAWAALAVGTLMLSPAGVWGEELIPKGAIMNVEQCIAVALQHQPQIRAGSMDVEASRARIGQARSRYLPQLRTEAFYDRYSPESEAAFDSDGDRGYDEYIAQLALTQNLYDFGRTSSQVKILKLEAESSRMEAEQLKERIVFEVKRAYFSLLQVLRNRELAQEMVGRHQKHLDQAKGFFEVGAKPRFDVTKAEVDLGHAKLGLIRAENALRIAWAQLRNTMGVPEAPLFAIEEIQTHARQEVVFEEVLERAYRNRSDLQGSGLRRQSSETRVDLARSGHYPYLDGKAYYRWIGEDLPLDEEWRLGVAVTLPLFTGLLTRHQVLEAKADLAAAKAREESLRQLIFLEVQRAYLNLREAEEKIPLAELTVRQGNENLDIAEGRYQAGVGDLIEVADAQVAYSRARADLNQALSDCHIARAALKMAAGDKFGH